ncbi:hypothetical protein GGI23_000117 [Coemansia sp. RSA 2559]|nr:hypothetical protein GGI23_000117 [Coemansia sp. RSA 2559]KAJ2869507.1 hypothetical protein GGI22_000224 [Coemansia erecta]
MRGIIHITTGLLLVGVASSKVFVNVPSNIDHDIVKSALSEHGIRDYDSMALPNENGLYLAGMDQQQQQPQQQAQSPQQKQKQQQQQQQQQASSPQDQEPPLSPQEMQQKQMPGQLPPAAPPSAPQQQQQPQMPRASSSPQLAPQPEAKQAEVPLIPAHGANVGLPSEPSHRVLTSTVVVMSTTTMPLASATPAIGNVGQAREAPPMTISIAGGPQTPPQQQQQQQQQQQAIAKMQGHSQAQEAAAEADDEMIDDDDVEEEATTTIKAAAPGAAVMTSAIDRNSIKASTRPEMLARAGASTFKPTDIDKFTFPSSDLSVNMSGPGKEPNNKSSSSNNIEFHASMPTAASDHPASSAKPINGKSASNSGQSAKSGSPSSAKGSSKKPSSSQVNDVEKDSGAAPALHAVRAASSAAAIAVAIAAIGGVLF